MTRLPAILMLAVAGCSRPAPPDVTAQVRQVALEACTYYVAQGESCDVDPFTLDVRFSPWPAGFQANNRDTIWVNPRAWADLPNLGTITSIAHEAAHCCRAATFGSEWTWRWWYLRHADAEERYAQDWAVRFVRLREWFPGPITEGAHDE